MEFDRLSLQILRALSLDSRKSANALAKELGVSPKTVDVRLKQLERELRLAYVPELDERRLGLAHAYLIKVKLRKQPGEEMVRKLLERDAVPQFAAFTKGDFDLFIYAVAGSNIEYRRWDSFFRQQLSEYVKEWVSASVLGRRYGFFPLKNGAIEASDLEDIKRRVLGLLAANARISLKEVAEKLGTPVSSAQYHLEQVLRAPFLRRCTAIMRSPPKRVFDLTFINHNFTEEYKRLNLAGRKMLLAEEDEWMKRLLFVISCAGVADSCIGTAFETEEERKSFHAKFKKLLTPIVSKFESATVSRVLVGNLPCRSTDAASIYLGDKDWEAYSRLEL